MLKADTIIGSLEFPEALKRADPALNTEMKGYENRVIRKYIFEASITDFSTEPKIRPRSPSRNTRKMHITAVARKNAHISTCLADSSARSLSLQPRYWLHRIVPPVAIEANRYITSLFMESTRETPDTAASPTLETMMVSTVPIRESITCSIISGITSFLRSAAE